MAEDSGDRGKSELIPLKIALLASTAVRSLDLFTWLIIWSGSPPMIITVDDSSEDETEFYVTELPERIRHLAWSFKRLTGKLLDRLEGAKDAKREVILRMLMLLSILLNTWRVALKECQAPDHQLEKLFDTVADQIWLSDFKRNLLKEGDFECCLEELQLLVASFVAHCGEAQGGAAAA